MEQGVSAPRRSLPSQFWQEIKDTFPGSELKVEKETEIGWEIKFRCS